MKFANRAKMTTSTTGAGPVTVGVASLGYQSFTAAGVVDGDEIRYVIEDGINWEIGTGVYNAGVITRSLVESSTGSLLSLSGSATILQSVIADDFVTPDNMLDLATAFTNSQTRYVEAFAFT
jgi:hypothetical protein